MKHENIGWVQHIWYGHTNVPAPSDFEFAWKAVKAVAAGDGVLSEPERQFLIGKMCAIATPEDVVERVMAFDEHSQTPASLLDLVGVPPQIRRATGAWIVYEAMSVAYADGELAPGEMAAVNSVASTMDVDMGTVERLLQIVIEEASLRERRLAALHGTIDEPFRFEPGAR